MNIKFNSYEIVFMNTHFSDFVDTMENETIREVELIKGQINLMNKLYPENFKEDGSGKNTALLKMINDELPQLLNKRLEFIKQIQAKFSDIAELIKEGDPNLFAQVEEEMFSEPEGANELRENLENE